MMSSDVLTVPELALTLRIGRNAAYELVRSGTVRSVKIGRSIRIPRMAIEDFLDGIGAPAARLADREPTA